MERLPATVVQGMLQVEDHVDIAYGYTFERATVYIYFENGKLVRTDERFGRSDPARQESEEFNPEFFLGIKRFYADRTNPKLVTLMNTFGTGLPLYHNN